MKVLILCTGNSCRSQMAHGFLQSFDPNITVCSAGTEASGKLNENAVKVMAETGIDISHHTSDPVDKYLGDEWDYVITVCGGANEACPAFTGKVKHRLHIGFDDPSHATGTDEFIRNEFIRVREEIREAFYKFYEENIKGNNMFRKAVEKDIDGIINLLKENNLPSEDISIEKQLLWCQSENEIITAVCGIEQYGEYALLRSLAVKKEFQNQGLGTSIYKHVINACTEEGIGCLFLLTETASGFFSKLGWESVSRTAVPAAVQKSQEFSSMCPQSADCMMLSKI